ncbi:MAG: hypothetical protein CM15mP115_06590 [Alphaproteobacteria bacterium]|nr:MAG: hypothetical protein CM15mP115_06590 [Alphaproteobacteria bacterium]
MSWPIISSTVTTLMVFLPLLFWPGIVGQFMKYLPITVMSVLIASLFMALIFIPVLGGVIGKKSVPKGVISATAPRSYRWTLKKAIRYPVLTMMTVIGIIVGSFSVYLVAGYGAPSSRISSRSRQACRFWRVAICRRRNVTRW